MKVFEVLRKGGAPSFPILKRDAANAEVINRVASPDLTVRYEFKRRGTQTWLEARNVSRLRKELAVLRLRTGDAVYVRRAGRSVIYVLRAVEYKRPDLIAPCPDSAATAGVKELWIAVNEATDEVEASMDVALDLVYMGIYNCRKIDGSSSWSQHASRNALDFRIRRTNAPFMSIDTEATTRVVNKVRAKAAQALWQVSGHYFHAHLTGAPIRYGTPACA